METKDAGFDFEEWSARFRNIVTRDAHAARSWQALAQAGADAGQLHVLFAFACDLSESPAFQLIETLRSNALKEARGALSLAARLDSDREALNSYRSSVPEGLLEKLAEGANQLRESALEVRKMFSRHKMNSTFFLSWLLTSIQEETGSPRYRDVSILLECAHVAYGHEMPMIGEEAVRKAHARFMKDSPFRDMLQPESKRNLLVVAAIFAAIQLLTSDQLRKPTPPRQTVDTSSSNESLVKSLDEIFRKQEGRPKS